MRRRLLIWFALSVGVLAAVGLGVDVVVVGAGRAAALAGVIAGFCELGAVLLGVAAWGDGRRARTVRAAAAEPAPAEPTGKYVVDARHARGVQVGDGAIQRNDFHPDGDA